MSPGEKVKLKTGGPWMTVDRVKDETAICIWFDRNARKQASFGLHLLHREEETTAAILEAIAKERGRT